MMKITLTVNGREVTLFEEELVSILEKHFTNETQITQQEVTVEGQRLRKGEWFVVNVSAIDRELFSKERESYWQEHTRKLILEAFSKVDAYPEKYSKTFETLIPEYERIPLQTVREYHKFCTNLGGHMADWVEQALEWAQRIANGESWDAMCDEPDTADWSRLIVWKSGFVRIVGGSQMLKDYDSAVVIYNNEEYSSLDRVKNVVPLVARRYV